MKETKVLSSGRSCADAGIILVIDGDNTLWDTNRVFEGAQRWLLASVLKSGHANADRVSFEELREIDDLLIRKSGRHEYDFRLLVLALLFFQRGSDKESSVLSALRELKAHPGSERAKIASRISREFWARLHRIPPLVPLVGQSIGELLSLQARHKGRLVLALLSEGDEGRIKPIIERHFGKAKAFDVLKVGTRKSIHTLHDVQVEGSRILESGPECSEAQGRLMVVGDSIQSDIVPGNSWVP